MFKCVSAVTAQSQAISCWAGIGISLVSGRSVSDKINYDNFYLHSIDTPINETLVNGNMEGPVFDCNDADIHFPSGWVPIGGSYGKYAGYNVSTYSPNAHSGSKATVFLCYPGKCDHGLMQRVRTYPGETLTASVYVRSVSSAVPTTSAAIGIDPTGGTDMFSPNVVWTFDNLGNRTTYSLITVSTIAQASNATVFIRAMSGGITSGYHTVYAVDATFSAKMTTATPSQIKTLPNGREISLKGCIVTAVFNGFFYVEDAVRISGIRIVSPAAVTIGQKVDIAGTMDTINGERCVCNAIVTPSL